MTNKRIIEYVHFIMDMFKGNQGKDGVNINAITSSIKKQYGLEYRMANSIFILLLKNNYLKECDGELICLSDKGHQFITDNVLQPLEIDLLALCDLKQPKDRLFYQLWEFIGEDKEENPYYVDGTSFYKIIKHGIEGLPSTYSAYVKNLKPKSDGAFVSRSEWYQKLFQQLDNELIPSFLRMLSDAINNKLQKPDKDADSILCYEDLLDLEVSDTKTTNSTAMSDEEIIIQKLLAATQCFSIQWAQIDRSVWETKYLGTSYRIYIKSHPYSESHEYFSYGLEVYHEQWELIAEEEEDPESTLLSPLGERLQELTEVARSEKHCAKRQTIKQIPIKENRMKSKKVFIVHGHDTDFRNDVENTLRKLKYEPVILCNQPNVGRTIIEKLEEESKDICFAVVLYTPCDEGRAMSETDYKPRARQNVVFEHGMMCAMLGRDHVVALVAEGVDIPGDLDGVVYIRQAEDWKHRLVKEMRAIGLDADANML